MINLNMGNMNTESPTPLKERFIYNPEGFMPDDFLPNSLQGFTDEARYLVHLIEAKSYTKPHEDFKWVNLKAQYLRRLLGYRTYEGIRSALVKGEVIEVNNHYVVGKQSMGYRLGDRFKDAQFKRVAIQKPSLLKKLNHMSPAYTPKNEVEERLRFWLEKLAIAGIKNARALVAAEEGKDKKKDRDWVRNRMLWLERVNDQDWYFQRDPYGRVHTNYSNGWSKLRPFVGIMTNDVEVRRLVNVDIVNSQPLFLGLAIIREWLELESKSVNKRIEYDIEYIQGNTIYDERSLLTPTYPLTPTPTLDRNTLPKDLAEYLRQVETGTFYEHMMKATNSTKERQNFKKGFFRDVLFQTRGYDSTNRTAFITAFPTAYGILSRIKAKDPKNAAYLLQRQESDFIINTCCQRLTTEFPDMPVLTIHDSIATTTEHVATVQRVISEEFAKLGIKPTLTTGT